MKKSALYLTATLLTLLVAGAASAQGWRGMNRIHGIVTDADGKPVKGAKVTLFCTKAGNGPAPLVTDAKGRWAQGNVLNGNWDIDVEAEGYLPRKMSAQVIEGQGLTPPIKMVLDPKPVEQPKPVVEAPKEVIQIGGVEVSTEIAKAVEDGNNYIKEKKFAEAATEYEKAVAVLTGNTALKFALARAYHGSGQLKKAVTLMNEIYAADTGNMTAATLLIDMQLEDGQVDDAKKVLAAMPPGSLTDVDTVMNIGIRFVNNNKPEDAWKYFNDAVGLAPDVPATYYYRGIAALQLKKMKEAKADLQKVVEIAPDSQEAADAKDLLKQMK